MSGKELGEVEKEAGEEVNKVRDASKPPARLPITNNQVHAQANSERCQ